MRTPLCDRVEAVVEAAAELQQRRVRLKLRAGMQAERRQVRDHSTIRGD